MIHKPDPPLSRVHELGRMSYIELCTIYHRLCPTRQDIWVHGKSRDQIIAAIREIEDPQ